jgi:hypothetical protein
MPNFKVRGSMGVDQAGIPVRVLSAEAAGVEAAEAWAAVPDRSDPRLLDAFVARYPASAEAPLAFALRHQLLRAAPSVPEYHRFIARYRGRDSLHLVPPTRYEKHAAPIPAYPNSE